MKREVSTEGGNEYFGDAYIRDTQRSKVVSVVLAATHLLSSRTTPIPPSQRRRHVRALLGRRSARRTRSRQRSQLIAHAGGDIASSRSLVNRRHGVLVRAAGRKVLAVANTTLDLLVAQFVSHLLRVGILCLVLGILAPR